MFKKLLVANRGEIACRIMRTARRLGIRTVAVYSQADRGARHVRLADEAIDIGPPPARESYLDGERVLEAARASGAEAIHPGYGFLAENADFADACARAGRVFIGPPASAIRTMGDKSAAKSLMETSGVPLVPGYHGADRDAAVLAAEAERIGYPILIKAAAGGGGKGMRIATQPAEFGRALAACRREAAASFGDDRVLLEKYLIRPRHIEVQVFADSHGNYVHLFERDCSIQRRHQKVLEEAPAPGVTEAQRLAMAQAALAAARAVSYVGAGTVESLVDPAGGFYFMEMNTRLQVEHPVTEMITGVDLVEWQLRVAAGEALPVTQEQIEVRGHAMEARIYAEDPENGFLPSSGKLVHFSLPDESPHVRVDTGVEQGDEIAPYYDPLIAKVIAWDLDRARALRQMRQALGRFRIVGVANNVEFLRRLIASAPFSNAELDTGLIERTRGELFEKHGEVPPDAYRIAALAVLLREADAAAGWAARSDDGHSPWHRRDGWRLNARAARVLMFRRGERAQPVHVAYAPDGYALEIDGTTVAARGRLGPRDTVHAVLGDDEIEATVVSAGGNQHIFLQDRHYTLACLDPLERGGAEVEHAGELIAPMPGRIAALLAEEGATVDKGTPLLVLEAMKMEHTIIAPARGRVRRYRFRAGDQVSEGARLVDFEMEPQMNTDKHG